MSRALRHEKRRRLMHFLPAVLFIFGFTMPSNENASAVSDPGTTSTDFQVKSGSLISTNNVICALTPTSGVKCIGAGSRNGDGTGVDRTSTAVDVAGLTSGVKSIATGTQTVCAVTTAGGAKCWGVTNVSGSASPSSSTSPVDVVGLTTGVENVSIGAGYSCFLTTTNNVKCVGGNNWGQLGNGTVTSSTTTTDVQNIDGIAQSLSSGSQSSCIVTTSRTVKCWGYGGYGNLGHGASPTYSSTPVDVSGLTSVAQVAVADNSVCALTTNGAVKCWGRNDTGQLGNGAAGNSNVPVNVTGLSSGVRAIRAGQLHFCAILDTGSMKCWGRNSEGQLGTGATSGNRNTPVDSAIATGTIVDVSAYLYFTCVLNSEGTVRCFGTHPYVSMSTTQAVAVTGLQSEHVGVRTLSSNRQVLMSGWYPKQFNYGSFQAPLNLGVRASTSEGITISSIFFAKGPDNTGTHTGVIWNSSGQVLHSQGFTGESGTGWQKVELSQPVYITANSSFTVGYSLENFGYPMGTYFPNRTVGPVTVGNGYYVYSANVTAFPGGTVDTNYGIDFEFIADSDIPTTTTSTTTTTTLPPITYSLSNAVWGTAGEGSGLTLTAPSGSVFAEVLFASYGTPTGSNGLYRTSSCDASLSVQQVEARFIGETSASLSANNGVFGDPCGGILKNLTVVLRYAAVPTSTTTTSSTTTTTTTTTLPPTTTTVVVVPLATTTTLPPTTTTTSTTTTSTTTTTTSTTTTTTLPPTTTTTSTTTTTVPPAPAVAVLADLGLQETSTKNEVVAAIANVIEEGVTATQATALASNAQVLESIEPDQAAEVFEAISVSELSAEQESALVAAVTNAPTEVKTAFEATIDVYASGFDEYVAVGSTIDVGSRKSLLAATAAVASVAAVASTGGSTGGSSGSSGGSSGGSSSSPQIRAGRRED
jgi:alpha-tubulin suppressor-like RCC1 family protein